MSEVKNEIVEVVTEEPKSVLMNNMSVLATPEGFQKFILGTKKNGAPRAAYDIVKDIFIDPKKKKKKGKGKKNKNRPRSVYDVYMTGKKKKKKKKGKHKKHHSWHIEDF